VGHVIGISGMAVVNEDGMIGAEGGIVAGKVIVTADGVSVGGGYEKFVGPMSRS